MGRVAQGLEVLLVANQGIDLKVVQRVIAVVGSGEEDRRQVDEVHAQVVNIVDLFQDALEVASAHNAPVRLGAPGGQPFRQLTDAVKAVHEDLVADAAPRPVGHHVLLAAEDAGEDEALVQVLAHLVVEAGSI